MQIVLFILAHHHAAFAAILPLLGLLSSAAIHVSTLILATHCVFSLSLSGHTLGSVPDGGVVSLGLMAFAAIHFQYPQIT